MMRKIRILAIRFGYQLLKIYWSLFKVKTKGVKVLIIQNEQVLLVKHSYGGDYWKLPGGSLKKDEDPIEAGKREMYEELGIEIDEFAYILGKYKRKGGDSDESITAVVATEWKRKRESLSPEILEFNFFDTSNVPENTQEPAVRRINDYKAGKREVSGELW